MNIAFNTFVRRQTAESSFSHWEIQDDLLIDKVKNNFFCKKPGYRDGVIIVPIDPQGFFSSVTKLKDGDTLVGEYKSRRIGEEPRVSIRSKGQKMPAKSVDVVLYRKDVLAEKNENTTDAEWEIVSINASTEDGGTPIHPNTLIANHFELSGGTATKMNNEQFVDALRVSFLYWKDKAMVG